MISSIIVDDEPLAITRLRRLLEPIPDVEIVGTAECGELALAMMRNKEVDLLFLDVQMPTADGFAIVESVKDKVDRAPFIIFVTAYPQFAAEAFDTDIIEFLTKPVRAERLANAVGRVRTALRDRGQRTRLQALVEQVEHLRTTRDDTHPKREYLWVWNAGEGIRLDLSKLDRLAGEGEYVRLFVEGSEYLHRSSVSAMMQNLDLSRFVRIHRSHVVRIGEIASIRRRPTGAYFVQLANGEKPSRPPSSATGPDLNFDWAIASRCGPASIANHRLTG